MIASIQLSDSGPGAALASFWRCPDPRRTPGLRFAIKLAAAPLTGSLLTVPQPRRVGLFALWDDDAALAEFNASQSVGSDRGGWEVRLEPLQAHDYHASRGSDTVDPWPPGQSLTFGTDPSGGPAVVVTIAQLRPTQVVRFLRASAAAAKPLATSPGLIWRSALVRPPVVSTLSLWRSAQELEAYAYGSPADAGHRKAMAADRSKPFHKRGTFFRFRPYQSVGGLSGRNPLPSDWLEKSLHPGIAAQ